LSCCAVQCSYNVCLKKREENRRAVEQFADTWRSRSSPTLTTPPTPSPRLRKHYSRQFRVCFMPVKASILWSHREETRELPGERDNARNSARSTQARKATHGLDEQHQDVDILWSHHEETRPLPGEKDNTRNNARYTQTRKASHGLDKQHHDVDRTPRGRFSQNDRGRG